ncbi:MAG: large conductance mechanosensitive channel protein MscL, partial [Clostridia bacterium]|nr:large conductance mechanosensitive channel protein MscL [Clostridia bacterium]
MAKKENAITRFFGEFKKFITRGNVLDMSVGVIVGGAFTGIVNGLSNFILKPFINWLLALVGGTKGLEGAITMLSPAYTEVADANGVMTKVLDLANSIYIDWGAFVSSIINFLLIAFALFSIVKIINSLNDAKNKVEGEAATKRQLRKELRKIRKEENVSKKEAKAIYEARVQAAKVAKEAEEAAAAAAAAEAEAA